MRSSYDVVIVGSGAAGSWAARTVAESGASVLILEAGRRIDERVDYPEPTRWDHAKRLRPKVRAALKGQGVQARLPGFVTQNRHFFVNDREHPYTNAPGSHFHWFRGRQQGGRLHVWGRIAQRMPEVQLRRPSSPWLPAADDLLRAYQTAEHYMGSSEACDGAAPRFDASSFAARLTDQEQAAISAINARAEGLVARPAPIMDQPLSIPRPLAVALREEQCDIACNTVVSHLEITRPGHGRVDRVHFVDAGTGEKGTVSARGVLLCASPIETVRILLNSQRTGFANASGLVGVGLMDHSMVSLSGPVRPPGVFPEGSTYDPSRNVGLIVEPAQWREGGTSSYVTGGIGRGAGWWLTSYGTMSGRDENRVRLDPRRVDACGVPLARIHLTYSPDDLSAIDRQAAGLLTLVQRLGLKLGNPTGKQTRLQRLYERLISVKPNVRHPGFAIHECGGARMGADPRTSVADLHQQCWDAPNLLIADASCFPECVCAPPTLTTMALAVRAGWRAVELLQAGEL